MFLASTALASALSAPRLAPGAPGTRARRIRFSELRLAPDAPLPVVALLQTARRLRGGLLPLRHAFTEHPGNARSRGYLEAFEKLEHEEARGDAVWYGRRSYFNRRSLAQFRALAPIERQFVRDWQNLHADTYLSTRTYVLQDDSAYHFLPLLGGLSAHVLCFVYDPDAAAICMVCILRSPFAQQQQLQP